MSSSSSSSNWPCPGGPCPPTTWEFGLIDCDSGSAAREFAAWLTDLDQQPSLRQVRGGFYDGMKALLPLTSVDLRRFLFFSTGTPWTVYFANGAGGSDASTLSHLAYRLGRRTVRIVDSPESDVSFGAAVLEVYGPKDTDFLNYIRSIAAMNDGGRWVFNVIGEPLPFEDISAYKRRRVRDRFTPGMLRAYVSALQADPFDLASYHDAILVERHDQESPGVKKFSFEEALERFRVS